MAQLQTYQVKTNQEDLTDFITNITPKKTPLVSMLESTKAFNTLHETQKDSLSVPTGGSSYGAVEGSDFTAGDHTVPDKVPTYTQIFIDYPKVSDTQEAVRTTGIKSMYDYQVTKKLKEIALKIEYQGINGTGNSGASGTAREIKGVVAGITTNHLSGTGTGGQQLSEDMFNDLMEDIWEKGGDPDTVLCYGSLKRRISSFTAGTTRNVDASDKRLVAAVDIYEGDFGITKIIAHRYMPAGTLVDLEQDLWAWAWLRKTQHKPLAKTGDNTRGMIVAEVALENRAEEGNGKYTNVTR